MTATARQIPVALGVAIVLTVVAGCSGAESPTASVESTSLTELESAQQLWSRSGVESYSFTLHSSCGERNGLGDFAITVDPSETQVRGLDRWSTHSTVDSIPDLFTTIKAAQDAGADGVDATYSETFGYPERIDIDYQANAIDDEACYRVSDFTSR